MRNPECDLCKTLSQNASKICVWGKGALNPEVIIVDGSPDVDKPNENVYERFLKKYICRAVGLDLEELYITTAVKCATAKKKNYSNALNCSYYLNEEIKSLKPKIIIAIGNIALNTIFKFKRPKDSSSGKEDTTGMSGIDKWRGRAYWHRNFNCWVVPTWGFDQVIKDREAGFEYMTTQMIKDFELALRCIKRPKKKKPKPKSFLINTPEKAIKVMKKMYNSKWFAEDWETDNLEFDPSNRLLGVVLCCEANRSYYIDWLAVGQSFKVQKALIKLNNKEDQETVFHNGAFDIKMLAVHKLTTDRTNNPWNVASNWQDSMIAAYLLDENFSAGLKPWVWRKLDFGGYEETIDDLRRKLKLKGFEGLENYEEELTEYAALDGAATYQLWILFKKALKKYNLWNLYKGIALPVRKELLESELIGIYTDKKRAERLNKAIEKVTPLMLEKMNKLLPLEEDEEFNFNSPKQLQDMFFKRLNLKPLKQTKTGYSTDAESLTYISNQKGGEAARWILNIKYLDKMRGTFIKKVLECDEDQRIRSSFNTIGTVTGRASSPIHNFPNDYAIRSLFTVPKGRVLIHADLSAAEMRVLAAYSGDPALIHAFNTGEDVHTNTYRVMFGKPKDYVPTKSERSIAKAINFGLVYGRGPKSLAEVLGVSLNKAYQLLDTYFKRLPQVAAFLRETVVDAHKYGYITNFFGRRRRLPEIHSDDMFRRSRAERQSKNSRIQGCSADYVNKSIADIGKEKRRLRLDADLILTVHDSLFYDTDVEDKEAMITLLKRKLDRKLKVLPIEMKCDVEVEKAWSYLEEDRESRLVDIFEDLKKEYKKDFLKGCLLPGIKKEIS